MRYPSPLRWPAVIVVLAMTILCGYARADSRARIDAGSLDALHKLREFSSTAGELLAKASAVLVFPDVVKMGFGAGGQYGEGSLLVNGKAVAYYATAGGSYGLKSEARTKSEVILFMTDDSLHKFRNSRGWVPGSDADLVLAGLKAKDVRETSQPVIAFIFSDSGVVNGPDLEGVKITHIAR